ncbi:PspC domain-containing protein [Microbacterium sp. ZW T6_19]|uniref:PspC domain-containing protein n=1 Tax=Microbacterium sp. ZW T6_19 TaxID=3378082 RepID=UPI003854627A
MTIPTEPPIAEPDAASAPPSPSPSPASHSSDRFFLWVAGLGVARSEGWLGGVSAGIAARLRIDPLIVRGVLVVAALFGLPVIFLYALAWALLPDADGRTHARDLMRRDYQPVQLGILAMAVIGLIPTAPLTGTVFGLGYVNWSALSILSWIAGLGIVVVLLVLIVRAASRAPGASAPDLPMASADPAAPAAPVTLGVSGTPEGAGAPSSGAGLPPASPYGAPVVDPSWAAPSADSPQFVRPEPPAAPAANDAESVAAWREQHAAWRNQDQAWRRQQQDAERAVRDQLRRERQAEAAVFAAAAAERQRIRRASNPRASFAYVAAVIGLAIVVGAGVGLWGGFGATAGAIGALAAALVLAIGMIVAGLWRRRSGFLAFATAATLVGGLIAGAASTVPQVTIGSASITNNQSETVTQPFGDTYVGLFPVDAPRKIDVTKGTGHTQIIVDPGVELDLRASVGNATVEWMRVRYGSGELIDNGTWTPDERNGERLVDERASSDEASISTVQTVTLNQQSGSIMVVIYEPEEEK